MSCDKITETCAATAGIFDAIVVMHATTKYKSNREEGKRVNGSGKQPDTLFPVQ